MRDMLNEIRLAGRGLAKRPGFALVAAFTLALGIGANVAIFTVVNAVLLRPLPFPDADRIVTIRHHAPGINLPELQSSPGLISLYREDARTLTRVAGYESRERNLTWGGRPERVRAVAVTPELFDVLATRPSLGRPFHDGDAREHAASVTILTDALWRSRFGGDSSVLGRSITVGKGTYTVAAVAPDGFRGVELMNPMDVWLPIAAAEQELYDGVHQAFFGMSEGLVQVIGRLRPDVAPQLVTTRAAAILQSSYLAAFGPRFGESRTVATLTRIVPGIGGERTKDVSVALWLTGVAAIVLLIACANVAGLLLVRATDRQREVGIRLALGATRAQLAQLFIVEGLILATAGGVAGVALRYWGGSVIRVFLLPQLNVTHGAFDGRVLAISAAVTLVTGIACGLVPALHSRRRDIAATVIGAPRAGQFRRSYARRALLVGQVALAMALVAGAALFIASWRNVREIQLGFTPDHVLVGRMPLAEMGYSTSESRDIYEQMLERVRALPGVRSVSVASHAPFVSFGNVSIAIPGVGKGELRSALAGTMGPELNVISPSFFTASGTALQRGRAFTDADAAGTEAVAIVNDKLARAFWPAGDAIGNCIEIHKFGPKGSEVPCSRIVGIVADTKSQGIRDDAELQMYAPLAQRPDVAPAQLVILTDGDPAALTASVRHAMQGAAAGLPFADVRAMSAYLEPELRPWRLGASMFSIFGAMALGLAAVGLYGVFSYAVSRRTREMGIRTALGARYGDILRLVLVDGLMLALVGMIIGIVLALGIGRILAALLVGVTGTSPILLGTAAALVLGMTLLAVGLPARRAASIDPAVALRDE